MSWSSAARRRSRTRPGRRRACRRGPRRSPRAVGMLVGPRRLGVDHPGEGDRDRSRGASSAVQHAVLGLPRRDIGAPRATPRTRRRRRSRRARRRAPGRTSRRCARWPCSRPRRHRRRRRISTVCARQRAPEHRDLLAPQAARLAAAVPVLVEGADPLRGLDARDRSGARSRRRGHSAPASATRVNSPSSLMAFSRRPRRAATRRGDRAHRPQDRRQLARTSSRASTCA